MNKLFCPISNSIKFEKIFSIKNFPIFMGVVNKNFKPEFKDLNFWINRSSGTVQIYPRVPLKKLYFKSHGSGKIGKTWGSHHKTFFNLINKYKKSNILEIGGGDNSYAFKADKKTLVTSIEVNPKKNVNNQNHILIKGFFDKPTIKKHKLKNFDMVVHSHLFEHIYDLNKFLRLIYSLLIRNGYHIFSIPNIKNFILSGSANGMNFEHTFFLSEDLVDYILKKNYFKIVDKFFFKGHSIMYVTKKIDDNVPILKSKYTKYYENKKIFINLNNHWIKETNSLNKSIESFSKNKKIFLFGAHIFSQILIKYNIKVNKISGIIDNDPDKHEQYLYGTKLKVYCSNVIRKFLSPVVIIRTGQYNQEIKRQLKKINKNVIFI